MSGEQSPWPAFFDRRFWLLMLLAYGAGAVLLLPQALNQALMIDELYTRRAVLLSAAQIVRHFFLFVHQAWDHPPLYFLLQRPVHLWLGDAPLVLRLQSLVCLPLGAALWGRLMWPLLRSRLAAMALVLLILAHPELRLQGAFARMYPLLLVQVGSIVLAVGRLAGQPRPRWQAIAALAVLLAVACYTSYFALLVGVGLGALGLLWCLSPASHAAWCHAVGMPEGATAAERVRSVAVDRATARRAGRALLVACVGAALLYSPWLPALHRLATLPAVRVGGVQPRVEQLLALLDLLTGGGWWFAAVGVGWLMILRGPGRGWLAQALLCLLVLPLALLLAKAPDGKPIHLRYVSYAVPLLLAAALLGWLRLTALLPQLARRLPQWALAGVRGLIVALALLAFLGTSRRMDFARNPEWWAVARVLLEQARPGERVLTGGYLSPDAVRYHVGWLRRTNDLPPEVFGYLDNQMQIEGFLKAVGRPDVVWYTNCAPLPPIYAEIVRRAFPWHMELPSPRVEQPILLAAKRPFLDWEGRPIPQLPPPAPLAPTP